MQDEIDHHPADRETDLHALAADAESQAPGTVGDVAPAAEEEVRLGEVIAGRLLNPLFLIMLALAVAGLMIIRRARWSRLPRQPTRPQSFEPVFGFAALIAAIFGGVLGHAIASAIVGSGGGAPLAEQSNRQIAITHFGAMAGQLAGVLPLLLLIMRVDARRGRSFRRPTMFIAAFVGGSALLVAWPCVHVAGQVAAVLVELLTNQQVPVIAHTTLEWMMNATPDVWLWFQCGMIVLLVPFLEEVMYRGILQETLRRLSFGPWLAIVTTSILFTLMHIPALPAHALAALLVLSLFFGWLYERTGRLAAPVALHIVFNGGNLLLAMMASGAPAS